MNYREFIILIQQSEMCDELKQRLYGVRAVEGLTFSQRVSYELSKILQEDGNHFVGELSSNVEPQTLETLLEKLEGKEAAKELDESYNALAPHLAASEYLGHEPFVTHAVRFQNIVTTAKSLLSDTAALNDALLACESFNLSPSPEEYRKFIHGELEYKPTAKDDYYHPDQLLDFLYSEFFIPAKHLRKNSGRILGYLKLAFTEEEFTNNGFTDAIFQSEAATEKLREAIVLQAVLGASIENEFVLDANQRSIKISQMDDNPELMMTLLKEVMSLARIISGDFRSLQGHLGELLETLRKTLAPYSRRMGPGSHIPNVDSGSLVEDVAELDALSKGLDRTLGIAVEQSLAEEVDKESGASKIKDENLPGLDLLDLDARGALIAVEKPSQDKAEIPSKDEYRSQAQELTWGDWEHFNEESSASEEPLSEAAEQALARIYHRLGDIYLINDCVKQMQVLVSDKLSYPYSYFSSNVREFSDFIRENQGGNTKLQLGLLKFYDPRMLQYRGFESEMQTTFDLLPMNIKFCIAAVVSNTLADYQKELTDELEQQLPGVAMEALSGIVTERYNQVSRDVMRALTPSAVIDAIKRVTERDLNLPLIDNITALEESIAPLENNKAKLGVNVPLYKFLISNLNLALSAFHGDINKKSAMQELISISQVAIDGDINEATKRLADLLYQEAVDEILNLQLNQEGELQHKGQSQQLRIEALIEAAVESVLAANKGDAMDALLPDIIARSTEHEGYDAILSGDFSRRLSAVMANLFDRGSKAALYSMTFLSAAAFAMEKGNTNRVDGFSRVSADEFSGESCEPLKWFADAGLFIPLPGDLEKMCEDHRELNKAVHENIKDIKSYLNDAVCTAVENLPSNDKVDGKHHSYSIALPSKDEAGVEFIVFKEDGEHYLRVIHDLFHIRHHTIRDDSVKTTNVGNIKRTAAGQPASASIDAVYKLVEKDGKAGLQLAYFETDSAQFEALLKNKWNDDIKLANFLLANLNINFVLTNISQQALSELVPEDLTINKCEALLAEQIKILKVGNQDNPLAEHAQQVLNEVRNLKDNPDVSESTLKKVLLDTTKLTKYPTPAAAQEFKQQAEQLQKRPWGKILGGAMLALAGVAILGLSIAACVFTFGAAAPITVLGFVLAASKLGAGLSVAGAVVGAGVAAGGFTLFGSGVKKKPLRKAMEGLAGGVDRHDAALRA